MANTKSAKKRARQNVVRRAKNVFYKARLRTTLKKTETLVETEPTAPETAEQLKAALRLIDKTASKGVFHRNTAARRKSRLVARFKKANAPSES